MGKLLRYVIPKTKDLELARFHYYLRNQQRFINFKHYALIALEYYLKGSPKILIKLDVSAPNKYVFNKDISIYISDTRILEALETYCDLAHKNPNIVFKEAICASLDFTDDKLWVAPEVYIKSQQQEVAGSAVNVMKGNQDKNIKGPIIPPIIPRTLEDVPTKIESQKPIESKPHKTKNPYIDRFTVR